MRLMVTLPVLAKDIGQLGAPLFLSCRQPRAGQQHDGARLQRAVPQIEQIQGTRGGAELGLADLQIALGALQRVMAQERLDGTEVHSAL